MEKIDMHIHTTTSDGKLTPFEIIDEAVKNNVKVLSIADHDTIDSYTEELFAYADKKNVKLIPAVEISTKLNKTSIHVLGYNIDIKSEEFKDALLKQRNARIIYLEDVAKKLLEVGYYIDVEKLSNIDGVTKAHIAEYAVTSDKNKEKLLEEYSYIPSKGEFIETVMNPGCPAFVNKKTLSPVEASKLIKEASGKVVLAHPVVYNSKDNISVDELKKLIIDMNADGVEANYIYINRNNEFINQIDLWNDVANELNLFTTIGSDFHSEDGINALVGLSNYENLFINLDTNIILENLKKD